MPAKFIIEVERGPDVARDEYVELAKLKLQEMSSLGYFMPGQVGFGATDWSIKVEVEHGFNHPTLPRGVRKIST